MISLENKITELFVQSLNEKETDFNFEKALDDLYVAYKNLKAKREANYEGYDLTESYLTACCFKLKDNLTLERLEDHKDRGRNLIQVLLMSAIQLGINQGIQVGKKMGRQQLLIELKNS